VPFLPVDTSGALTVNDIVSYVSLIASLLLAARVIFSTESGLKAVEKASSIHESQITTLNSSSSDSRAAHAALVERVNSINATMESKASVESVAAVREAVEKAVENLRREQEVANRSVILHLQRIEAKVEKLS
jgi:hypothetical protein